MNLDNRLREVRTERGLTQQTLAEAVGVTRQSIIKVWIAERLRERAA